MSSLSALYDANLQQLHELARLARAIDNVQLSYCPSPFSSSAGAHIRHITDHYCRFIQDLATGFIRYDLRQRSQDVETDTSCLQKELDQIIRRVEEIAKNAGLNRLLSISMSVAVTSTPTQVSSSIARELIFLHSHTIHHLAQVQTILSLQGIHTTNEFGTAPSTIKHNSKHRPDNDSTNLKRCA